MPRLAGVSVPVSMQVTSPHPPNFCILVLSHAVSSSGLQDFAVVRLQEALTQLSINLSACDRILNTPIPLSYTRCAAAAAASSCCVYNMLHVGRQANLQKVWSGWHV
jgi:predicted membrane chloride channel (bestrophin family)